MKVPSAPFYERDLRSLLVHITPSFHHGSYQVLKMKTISFWRLQMNFPYTVEYKESIDRRVNNNRRIEKDMQTWIDIEHVSPMADVLRCIMKDSYNITHMGIVKHAIRIGTNEDFTGES